MAIRDEQRKALELVLHEIMARWGIPGLGVGIVQQGEIVYQRGFGVQSLGTGSPVTPGTIFCTASISKIFVATAVVQLAGRGWLDLDAPLVQYLPYFQLDDPRSAQITLRQILSHTSGMPDIDEHEYDGLVGHPECDAGAAERFVRSLGSRKMVAAPGERFRYSNLAYDVLGDLIAKVSGQDFETYLKEQILRPAGMAGSTFLLEEVDRRRLALPHLRMPAIGVNPIYPYHRADAPASFLHATTGDMCRWAITCLNRGTFGGRSILSPAGFDLMWTPVVRRGYPPLYEEMGLGWNLGHIHGVKTASHGGMGFGWTAFFLLLPEKGSAAIVLCNEESDAHSRITDALIQVLFGQEPQAGPVSWMVPVSQALAGGGAEAAWEWYAGFKARGGQEYSFDEDDLTNLMYQLQSVNRLDLAIEVLRLNLHVFPRHFDTCFYLADFYLRTGDPHQAEECLNQALSIRPGYAPAVALLEKARCMKNG